MSKDSFEDKYNDYDEDITSDYDTYDLEESVRMSRKARREAREKRRVKKASGNKEQAKRIEDNKPEQSKKTGKRVKEVSVPVNAAEENFVPKNTKKEKPKKKKTLRAKFFSILFTIVGIYACVIAGCIIYTYLNLDPSSDGVPTPNEIVKNVTQDIADIATGTVPERTTFLLLVTDEDKTRTDTIVMANYDNINSRLSMISVPRDTIVSVSAATFDIMRSEYPEPGKRIMKINAVHHYGASDGVKLLKTELERLYDFKPDYYVKFDFDAFNYMVDSIGGLEFNVPINMDYDDPTQDLHIHLQQGVQVLDGKAAQHLVRYRKDNYGGGYPGGDLQRITVQQDFMKAFIKKATSADAILKNPKAYITAFFKYVDTDMSIMDAVKYIKVAKTFNPENIVTYTLPGEPAYVSGISGYITYDEQAQEMLYNVFKKPLNEITTELAQQQQLESIAKSTDKSIIVLNGSYKNGYAGEVKSELEMKGYTVSEIGDFSGAKEIATRIYVSEEGVGEDLKLLLEGSKIVLDSSVTANYGYDIVIVIGTGEE